MTFDEVEKYIKENCYLDQYGDKALDLDGIDDLITLLKKEYTPTIEMTEKEREKFLSIATSSVTFTNFYEQVLKQSTNIKLGIQSTPDLYKQLSEKELMQAWLHPETIKVVEE